MSNKTYDILKWVAAIFIPAATALYATVGDVWGFPYIVEITATLAAIDTFLGALLGISSITYQHDSDALLDAAVFDAIEEAKKGESDDGVTPID